MERNIATVLIIYSFLLGAVVGILIFLFFIYTDTVNEIPIPNNIKGPDTSDIMLEIYNLDEHRYEYFNRTYDIVTINKGQSMNPTINEGDTVICYKDFTEEELSVGNIIIYIIDREGLKDIGIITSSTYGVHRIISKRELEGKIYYTAKGDNNKKEDPIEFTKNEVVCVVGGIIY